MGFPALPPLSAATELFVVNLVAQHDPQADTQFVRRRNPRLAHPFLDKLATIEAFQLRIFSYRMDRRFGPQIAQDRKSTRLNSSHSQISYAVFCLKKNKSSRTSTTARRTYGCDAGRRVRSEFRRISVFTAPAALSQYLYSQRLRVAGLITRHDAVI